MFLLRYSSVSGWRGKHQCLGTGNSGWGYFFPSLCPSVGLQLRDRCSGAALQPGNCSPQHLGGSQALDLCLPPLKHLPITPGAVGTDTWCQCGALSAGSHWNTPRDCRGIAQSGKHWTHTNQTTLCRSRTQKHSLQPSPPGKEPQFSVGQIQAQPTRAEFGSAPSTTLGLIPAPARLKFPGALHAFPHVWNEDISLHLPSY